MNKVAEINNIPVYSDKDISSIIDSKILFTDNSWCDVQTGKIMNQGGGYIFIDPPQQKTSGSTVQEKRFQASRLYLLDIMSKVVIEGHNDPDIALQIQGSASDIANIACKQKGDTLEIKETSKSSKWTTTSSIRKSKNCVIVSSGKQPTLIITIKVPASTPIIAKNISGEISIGVIESDMELGVIDGTISAKLIRKATLKVFGNGDIIINKITGALDAFVQGSGDITIDEISNEKSVLKIQGSGDIAIKKGNIQRLDAIVQGNGDISYGGTAIHANLTIMGSGDIDIHHIQNKPSKTILGNGDIDIGNW